MTILKPDYKVEKGVIYRNALKFCGNDVVGIEWVKEDNLSKIHLYWIEHKLEELKQLQAANDKCKETFRYIKDNHPRVWEDLINKQVAKFSKVFGGE